MFPFYQRVEVTPIFRLVLDLSSHLIRLDYIRRIEIHERPYLIHFNLNRTGFNFGFLHPVTHHDSLCVQDRRFLIDYVNNEHLTLIT